MTLLSNTLLYSDLVHMSNLIDIYLIIHKSFETMFLNYDLKDKF